MRFREVATLAVASYDDWVPPTTRSTSANTDERPQAATSPNTVVAEILATCAEKGGVMHRNDLDGATGAWVADAMKLVAETGEGQVLVAGPRGTAIGTLEPGGQVHGSVVIVGSGAVGARGYELRDSVPTVFGASRDAVGRAWRVVAIAGGVRKAAELLRVSPSTVTRWTKGERAPAMEEAAALVDLEYVLTRVSLVYPGEAVAADWLRGHNGFLDDRRPIDVLREDGPGPVIAALESEAAGSYP
jgi:hypothetical protein